MAIGLGAKLARLLLLTFNFIFWLSGIGLIGVGIWLYITQKRDVLSIIQPEGATSMNRIAAYCVIGVGCFVVLVGFLGCCGAMHENRCMLVTYFTIVLIILLAEVVGGILLVIYKKQLEETMQARLQDSLQMKYGVTGHDTLTSGFNTIQKKHHCCGVMGPGDYFGSAWYNQSQLKADKDGTKSEAVPLDCCNQPVADGILVATMIPRTCYTNGCFEAVKNDILQLHGILIGVGAGIAGLELLGMIFAICLCRNIDYDI